MPTHDNHNFTYKPRSNATNANGITQRRVPNGLTIIAKEMHASPVTAFCVWYRVGSRNEHVGITGVSHWVEHMMFKGTPKYGEAELDRW